jgi:hypothetical protein
MYKTACFEVNVYMAKIIEVKKNLLLWYFINVIIGFEVVGIWNFVAYLVRTATRFYVELAD